jgi:hypothetical protein
MALGNAWFVKNVQFEKDSRAVMKALDTFNPKDTAIANRTKQRIEKIYLQLILQLQLHDCKS